MEQRIFRLARAGGIDTNPTTFTQRAGTFASAATNTGQATLLTRRESTGLNGYLIVPAAALGTNAPLHLAHTVGARAEETQMPEDLGDTPAIGTLTYKPSPALRETQAGIDPTELPRLLANAMPEGSWVAVTMRKPSNRERKFYTPWLGNRMGTAVPTHHSTSPTAVLVSITAGGASEEEVTSLLSQVTAGLPGFDLDSGVKFAPSRHALFLGLPAGLLLAAATLFGLPQLPAEYAAFIPAGIAPILYGIAGVAAILGLAALTGRIASPDTKLRNQLAAPSFAAPAARRGRPRPPRKEQTIRQDGMRIVFELTATASASFESKVRRWAELIAARPLETSGLTVVFVAAPHSNRSRHTSADPCTAIYKKVAQVLRDFPGRGKDSPAARIGVAHWESWFPDKHLMSEAFLDLEADFAINDGTGPERWATRGMLTGYEFTPWHTFDATAVLENSKLLAATPHWMRKGNHTALIGSPMDSCRGKGPAPGAGQAAPVQRPAPGRSGRQRR